MLDFLPRRREKLGVSLLTVLMCSACGGGGGGSASTTPAVAVNQPPSVVLSSKTVITEGQPFEVDASGSSDADGDALTYSWRQLSGPTFDVASLTESKLSLTAPILDADETASFEVTVSDGALTTVSTVSVGFENVKVEPVISQSTAYGTGGPQTPTQTIPDPSIYEGQKPLDRIIGLTTEGIDGYRVHWTASGGGHDMPVSSQSYSGDGEKLGTQTDGVFLGGDQGTYEFEGRTYNRFSFGVTFATVQSDDTLFNLNGRLEFGDQFTLGYTSYRGLVEGEIDGFGDSFIEQTEYSPRVMGGTYTPIGQDSIVLTLSERTTDDPEDEEGIVFITSQVVDKLGRATEHSLGEYVSYGTAQEFNKMTSTSYGVDNYLTAWAQRTESSGYDIRMQRANEDGILFGEHTTVNELTSGAQVYPLATTLTDGDIFVSWLDLDDSEDESYQIKGRIIQPDGTFASGESVLMSGLSKSEEFSYALTALNTNDVLLSWGLSGSDDAGIKAVVFDRDLNMVSNEFVIAGGVEAEGAKSLLVSVLPDNRVIMGWFNDYPYADREEMPDTSHTVGFYPVGKD